MILVTGGAGFIGSYLVGELVRRGEDIRVLVKHRMPKEGIETVSGDVTDRGSLRKAFNGVEKVYHLAAIFRHDTKPEDIWRVNYEGTKNVAEAALERGTRLLYVSTVGVLGYANSKPLDENSPYRPNPNAYSRSKAKAEQVILDMRSKGLDCIIVRPAFVYGIGSRYGLNLLVDMVAKGKLRWIIGKGENYVHPIHVEDLVKALIAVMDRGEGVYIAANEVPIRLRELLDLVALRAGVRVHYGFPPALARLVLKVRGGIGGSSAAETLSLFTRNWFYKVEKLKSLGWRQNIDIETGIGEVVEWLLKLG